MLLETINSPAELKQLSTEQCAVLAGELRQFIVDAVSRTGGHLGSNLGMVEITLALHRVFDSPEDILLFDTGHQAYVHKLLTGRREGFARLRQEGGLSGYPNRAESEHDRIENSHASTALSYAHGIATALRLAERDHRRQRDRHVVAVVGDGALTGGMAYEALNNLGHSGERVLIVLNDNGRSYAPTISRLSESLTQLRLNPTYVQLRERARQALRDLPVMGPLAYHSVHGLTAALREVVEPHVFFEALGVRYIGPIDGHDLTQLEEALARAAAWKGPIVLHALTVKGKGYAPAEQDDVQRLHDLKVPSPGPLGAPGAAVDGGAVTSGVAPVGSASFTDAFSDAVCALGEADQRVVTITAAMPGPTGLLGFQHRFPDRFIDVGIAEQHALTAAAGLAMAGSRPVVAIYSTFLSRAFDQWNLDVGLHRLPVVIVADRAGITGDDGPSHHGVYDLMLGLSVPDLAICCPSEPAEIAPLLAASVAYDGPVLLRYPKTPSPGPLGPPGEGFASRTLRAGDGEVVLIGIGKMARVALEAAALLEIDGVDATVIDPRVIRPVDPELLASAASGRLVVTVEDGLVHGGAGRALGAEIEALAVLSETLAPRMVHLGVPTTYLAQGKPDAILGRLGLDPKGVATSVRAALGRALLGREESLER